MARSNMKQTAEKAQGKIPKGYDMKYKELQELFHMAQGNDLFGALAVAFTYGFVKGVRAHERGRVTSL